LKEKRSVNAKLGRAFTAQGESIGKKGHVKSKGGERKRNLPLSVTGLRNLCTEGRGV